MKSNKGLSLAEVIVTMALVGLLGAVATTSYSSYVDIGKKNIVKMNLDQAHNKIKICLMANKNKVKDCNTPEKVGFKLDSDIAMVEFFSHVESNRLCIKTMIIGENEHGKKGCLEVLNGSEISKCIRLDEDGQLRTANCINRPTATMRCDCSINPKP